ncbi:Uncharacterised protein [uncultured Collinsella sp.]|nr:Uncharacterised protein [uncultured Collinsella sp.]
MRCPQELLRGFGLDFASDFLLAEKRFQLLGT